MDFQCELTGEALIPVLQDDIRLLTHLEPDVDVMLNRSSLTIVTVFEERERRGRARVQVFSGGGTLGTIRSSEGAILIASGHLRPHAWISLPQAQQIAPVKSLLPLAPPTQLSSPHLHCYLTRNTLPALDHLDSFPTFSGTSALAMPAPSQSFFLNAGMHAQKKIDL